MERYQNRPRSPGSQEDQGIPQFQRNDDAEEIPRPTSANLSANTNSYLETLLCNFCINDMMPRESEIFPWNDRVLTLTVLLRDKRSPSLRTLVIYVFAE